MTKRRRRSSSAPRPSRVVRRGRPWGTIALVAGAGLVAWILWFPIAAPPEAPAGGGGAASLTTTSDALSTPGAAAPLPAFVGGETCAQCHAEAAEAWRGSHHDLAMQPATSETVLGDFGGATFSQFGVTSRFFTRDGRYFVRTEGADGALDDFEVRYTFGVDPLQQYLIELSGGRVQSLSVAWDTNRRRWFSLYPDERIPPNDPLHWTGRYQRWNVMCVECHSTNVRRNYDAATDTYQTAWSEIDVSCEACHGPGADHVRWAQVDQADRPARAQTNLGLVVDLRPGAERQEAEIRTCAPCHSRRQRIARSPRPDRPFLDGYRPVTLREGLYQADGQILDEVYVYGSFLQSKMYAAGVRCSNCHEPHGLTFEVEGNAVCVPCHRETPVDAFPSLKRRNYDTSDHHHHEAGSAGAQCVNCHMPVRTYMQVDSRRDHSFRVPRPDLSVRIGTPNACTSCHEEQDDGWATDVVAEWRRVDEGGAVSPWPPHYGETIAAGRAGDRGAWPALATLARDAAAPAIVRATALELLVSSGEAGLPAYAAATLDPDPLVRVAAVAGFDTVAPERRLAAVAPLLADPVRAVRIEAARVLAGVSAARFVGAQRDAFDRAIGEFIDAQLADADLPGAHLNLGVLRTEQGRLTDAEQAYRTALELDPDFQPARLNLVNLYNRQGRNQDAEAALRQGLERRPDEGELHYALGLLLAEEDRLEEAAESLGRAAARLARARVHYNHGLALQRLERPAEAERALLEAQALDASDPDITLALATFYVQQEEWARARTYATALIALVPEASGPRELLEEILRQQEARR